MFQVIIYDLRIIKMNVITRSRLNLTTKAGITESFAHKLEALFQQARTHTH